MYIYTHIYAYMYVCMNVCTVRHRGMETGISEASKRVPIFPFATRRNWVQVREAQIRFPAG